MSLLRHGLAALAAGLFLLPITGAARTQKETPLDVPDHSCSAADRQKARPADEQPAGVVAPVLRTRARTPYSPEIPAEPQHVTLKWAVDATGAVDPCGIYLVESTSDIYTKVALNAILSNHYQPATLNGQKIKMWVQQTYRKF